MKAVILAAGKGVRLKPLTDITPKAMVLLKGKPLLEHVLLSLKGAGVDEVVIIVGYLKEKIIDYFGTEFLGMKISYAEQKQQSGTAHALLQAKSSCGEDFLAGFADTITTAENWKLLAEEKSFPLIAAVREEKKPERFGVVETEGKMILRVVEKPEKPKTNLVAAGFYKFSPEIFSAIGEIKKSKRGELELTDAINILAAKKKAGFVKFEGKIIDIGSVANLEKAESEK